MELIVVTGMSGAGKSKALNALEDLGYYAMDNLPPALLPKFIEIASATEGFKKVAVVIDVRSGKFFDDFSSSLDSLKKMDINYKILFLDADEDIIINRYKEKRRPHPLNDSIVKGYKMEEKLLKDIKKSVDILINTSNCSEKELKKRIREFLEVEEKNALTVSINSFGFKNGILLDADNIFDVRFLPNPYYIKELKHLDGTNKETKDYVMNWDVTKEFINKSVEMLNFLIPNYLKEGKSVLVVGFGCTGGFHRSVVMADEVGRRLKELGHNITINHRDKDMYG